MKRFDYYVQQFLKKNPNSIIINLGCGLDTRFFRLDNHYLDWYDLDLPNVIEIRKYFFNENERYHIISSSVLDFNWINLIQKSNRPILLIAEGLFMYLFESEIKSLILELQSNFQGCEIACEVVNSFIVKKMQGSLKKKFQKRFHLGENVTFNWGIKSGTDIEKWNSDIKLIEEWTYFDDREKKLGWFNFFRHFSFFKKTQWIVYYILN